MLGTHRRVSSWSVIAPDGSPIELVSQSYCSNVPQLPTVLLIQPSPEDSLEEEVINWKKWIQWPVINHFLLFSRAHLLEVNHLEDSKVLVIISWVLTKLTPTEHL